MDSILGSVKKIIGFDPTYNIFEEDLILHINSIFAVLHQLGVGPDEVFEITSDSETWDQFTGGDAKLNFVKSYVCIKCKMLFDPPNSSVLAEAYQKQIAEYEWRLNVLCDNNR